jgi:hypothetical protein
MGEDIELLRMVRIVERGKPDDETGYGSGEEAEPFG